MEICTKCGGPVEPDSTCKACDAASAAPASKSGGPSRPSGTPLLLIALGVFGAGTLMLLAAKAWPPSVSPPSDAAPQIVASAGPVTAREEAARGPEAPRPKTTPRWTANRASIRGQAHFTFELVADNDLIVRQNVVRPILIVRCALKTTEVFVLTKSPASIERDTRRHTIKLSFDDQPETTQMWDHSIEHDALFAPDGGALAQQIASAGSMSFTFTPFNADAKVIRFSVAGFRDHLNSAAQRSCGWTS